MIATFSIGRQRAVCEPVLVNDQVFVDVDVDVYVLVHVDVVFKSNKGAGIRFS